MLVITSFMIKKLECNSDCETNEVKKLIKLLSDGFHEKFVYIDREIVKPPFWTPSSNKKDSKATQDFSKAANIYCYYLTHCLHKPMNSNKNC